jgi:hypothetical protein
MKEIENINRIIRKHEFEVENIDKEEHCGYISNLTIDEVGTLIAALDVVEAEKRQKQLCIDDLKRQLKEMELNVAKEKVPTK